MPLRVIGSRQAWAGEPITLILISERKHIGCWPGLSYVGLVLGFQFLNSPFVFFVLGVRARPWWGLPQSVAVGVVCPHLIFS